MSETIESNAMPAGTADAQPIPSPIPSHVPAVAPAVASGAAEPAINPEEPPKKGGKKCKMKRTATSIRPGQTGVPPAKLRSLILQIKSNSAFAKDETEKIGLLADELRKFPDTVIVEGTNLLDGTWTVLLKLRAAADVDDDTALSAAFVVLEPVWPTVAAIRDGFTSERAKWKFLGHELDDNGAF
jgi:hypothetical protein